MRGRCRNKNQIFSPSCTQYCGCVQDSGNKGQKSFPVTSRVGLFLVRIFHQTASSGILYWSCLHRRAKNAWCLSLLSLFSHCCRRPDSWYNVLYVFMWNEKLQETNCARCLRCDETKICTPYGWTGLVEWSNFRDFPKQTQSVDCGSKNAVVAVNKYHGAIT